MNRFSKLYRFRAPFCGDGQSALSRYINVFSILDVFHTTHLSKRKIIQKQNGTQDNDTFSCPTYMVWNNKKEFLMGQEFPPMWKWFVQLRVTKPKIECKILYYNAISPGLKSIGPRTAVAGKADSVSSLSASACHKSGQIDVNPSELALVYGNAFSCVPSLVPFAFEKTWC